MLDLKMDYELKWRMATVNSELANMKSRMYKVNTILEMVFKKVFGYTIQGWASLQIPVGGESIFT